MTIHLLSLISLEHFGQIITSLTIIDEIAEPGQLSDIVISNLRLKVPESQGVLEILDPVARLKRVSELLTKEYELLVADLVPGSPEDEPTWYNKTASLLDKFRFIPRLIMLPKSVPKMTSRNSNLSRNP